MFSKFYLDPNVSSLAQAINNQLLMKNPMLSRRLEEMERIATSSPNASTAATATNPSSTSSAWTAGKDKFQDKFYVTLRYTRLITFMVIDFSYILFMIGINVTYSSRLLNKTVLPYFITSQVLALFTVIMLFIDDYHMEPKLFIELLKVAYPSPV